MVTVKNMKTVSLNDFRLAIIIFMRTDDSEPAVISADRHMASSRSGCPVPSTVASGVDVVPNASSDSRSATASAP